MCLSKWTTLLALIETLWEKPKTFIRRKKNCLRTLFNSYHYWRNSQVFLVSSSDSVLLYRFSISTYSGESGRTTRFFIRYLLAPTQLGFQEIPGNPKCDVKRSHATDWVVSGVTLRLMRASPSWKPKQTLLKPSNEQHGYKKPPKSQSLDARFCCSARVACKWCHGMFGCVAITTPQTLGGTRIEWKSNTG